MTDALTRRNAGLNFIGNVMNSTVEIASERPFGRHYALVDENARNHLPDGTPWRVAFVFSFSVHSARPVQEGFALAD